MQILKAFLFVEGEKKKKKKMLSYFPQSVKSQTQLLSSELVWGRCVIQLQVFMQDFN